MVGVPDTVPEELMETPAGRPVAVNVYGAVPPDAETVKLLIAVPTVPDLLPGLATLTSPGSPPVQVGSPVCAGTLIASHASLTALNSVQLVGCRVFAAWSVQVR